MIEKIGAVFLFIIAIFGYGKFKGRQDEKNKQNKKGVDTVKNSKRISRGIRSISRSDKLKRL